MIQFFNTILNFLKAVFGLIFMILDHIIQFILHIPDYFNFVLGVFYFFPAFARPFVIVGALFLVSDLIYKKVRGVK